ncbi:hypothetical protein C0991_004641 [Blastosporella zonata]|nr:hypothetical protein C0991_004641 [Blastosporella zonata]
MATTIASYKPKIWREGRKGIMVWRPVYGFPIFVFPVVAFALQTAVTFTVDRRGRSDDLHCDYSDPEWIRFVSYAGTPFLLTVPSLYFSITSIIRIHKTNQHLERSRDPDVDIGAFTSMPRRQQHVGITRASSSSSRPSDPPPPTASRQTSSPTLNPNRVSHTFTIPTALSLDTRRSSISSFRSEDSRVSSSFPTFVNPHNMGTVSIDPDRMTMPPTVPDEEWREVLGVAHVPPVDMDKVESLKWTEDGDFEYGKGDDFVTEDGRSETAAPPYTPRHGMHFGNSAVPSF